MVDVRIALIRDWLSGELGWPRDLRLEPASADASFRRYFRIWRASGSTAVVMDAPPEKEDTAPYLHISSGRYQAWFPAAGGPRQHPHARASRGRWRT